MLIACMPLVFCYAQKVTVRQSMYSDMRLNKLLGIDNDDTIIDYVLSLRIQEQEIIQKETEKQIMEYYGSKLNTENKGKGSSLPSDFDGDNDADGHRSISSGGDDCNDNNPFIYPGNTEICGVIRVIQIGGIRLINNTALADEDCDPCTVSSQGSMGAGGDGDKDRDGDISCNCANFWNSDVSFREWCISPGADENERKWHTLVATPISNNSTPERSIRISGVDCDDKNPAIGKNSQVCLGETQMGICIGGVWQVVNCRKCQKQPNGTGVVIEW